MTTAELHRGAVPDVEYLRGFARLCLRIDMPLTRSDLADIQRLRNRPEAKLSKPDATYTVSTRTGEVERRKPAHGQWTTIVHASATRPPGFSKMPIADWNLEKSRYVRALWKLKALHICSILARYAASDHQREAAAGRLAIRAAAAIRAKRTRERAKAIALGVLDGATAEDVRWCLGIEPDDWRGCEARQQLYAIRSWLATLDAESLMAWEEAWPDSGPDL
jgi:hypothetical protein